MTPQQIKKIIKSVGIPCAYYQFEEETGQQPPFICYFFDGSADLYADNINYCHLEKLYIELYTDRKDFELEDKLQSILNRNEIAYLKEESNIDSEHMHVTVYTTTINLEVQDG